MYEKIFFVVIVTNDRGNRTHSNSRVFQKNQIFKKLYLVVMVTNGVTMRTVVFVTANFSQTFSKNSNLKKIIFGSNGY